jgi:hypothetical protein
MVSIDVSGLRFERVGANSEKKTLRNALAPTNTATGELDAVATPASKLSALTNWPESLGQSLGQTRQGYYQNAILNLLDKKLSAFEDALDAFEWPATDFPWRNSRLTDKDQALNEKLSLAALGEEAVTQTDKLLSKSVNLNAKHGLKNKTYSLALSLGGQVQTLRIAVDQTNKTWGDLFEQIAQAVNDASLPAQASIRKSEDGHVLALSVDAGLLSQDLELEATPALGSALDFTPVSNPQNLTPTLGATLIQTTQRASESVFQSSDFDPNAAVTLATGAYSIGYTLGARSGTVRVTVNQGDTWKDLLKRAGNALSAISGVETEVESSSMANYALGYRLLVDSERLTVASASDKLGARLRLTEGLAEQSASFHDPNNDETPPEGEQGQIYIATSTGNGWTQDKVYIYGGQPYSWLETDPVQGDVYAVAGENYRYDESQGWVVSESLLTGLGLGATASPGSDATIRAQGETQTSATGVFRLDQGRVLVATEQISPDKLPVSVVEGMTRLANQLNEVAAAYNGLQDFFKEHRSLLKSSFTGQWSIPLGLQKKNLEWLGVNSLGAGKTLWVNGDAFAQALYQDPDRARDALVDATETKGVFLTSTVSGLIPAWSELASRSREHGLESALSQTVQSGGAAFTTDQTPTLASSALPPWRKNLENEEDKDLLDLFG